MQGVVGTLRVPAYWFQLEPRPGKYEFGAFDRLVGAAAEHGIRVLPFVYGSPHWLRSEPAYPPHGTRRGRAAWVALLRRLVRRYGPRGRFWSGTAPRLPIRRWQIWNEPNFRLFWRPRPSPRGYARLLRQSAQVIRREDRGARIVAAGVAPVEGGMLPWAFLRRMYRVRGAGRAFDVAAVHPYGSSIRSVTYQIRKARQAMARGGDAGKPLRVTELGIASDGLVPSGFDKGLQGQARFLQRAYRLLMERRRRWRIGGVDWFAWRDLPSHDSHCVFCQYAGLFDAEGNPKPSWWVFLRLASRGEGFRR